MWYALDGTNLYNISGGENSGRLELTEQNGELPEKYYISIVMMTPRSYEILKYLIKDIDGNGTDELIFGGNETSPDSAQAGIIYDIYNIGWKACICPKWMGAKQVLSL